MRWAPTTRAGRVGAALALATAIAMPAEGLRQAAYRDPVGVLTICYGSTQDVRPGQIASMDECRARLADDMLEALEHVERCAPGLAPHQLAALGDAVFNLGPRIVCDRATSGVARALAEGDVTEACDQLPRWNKARVGGVLVELPGLTKRRARERAVCLFGEVG